MRQFLNMMTMFPKSLIGLLIFGAMRIAPHVAYPAEPLENDHLRVEFGSNGIALLHDKTSNRTLQFQRDGFSVGLDGRVIDSEFFSPTEEQSGPERRVFAYNSGAQSVRVIYELQPDWHFVSKQVAIHGPGERTCRIQRIELCRGQLGEPVQGDHQLRDSLLLRLGDQPAPSHGAYFLLQNPFSQIRLAAERFSIAYAPETPWKSREPYISDRLLIGVYTMSGIRFPAQMEPEWRWVPPGTPREGAWVDTAEIDALVECVRAFLTYQPEQSVRVHIGWCENDYQIDIGTAEGQAEYRRILDQAAAVGCGHVLVTPANNPLAPLSENQDAWGWENLLWFNLGQKVRKDEWDPPRHPIPASVQSVLDDCKARGLKPMAYVYPTLPFRQNPEWTSWFPEKERGPYQGADTGQRSFQDWLVGKLVDFSKHTGAAGYSFDHWWIAYDETVSSRYAQWDGCRRVLQELRRRLPDAVLDGRQQYHGFGPWTWVAGTYPHPLASDEQPESFRSFPDLHWDRGSANRQRRTAWWYRMAQLAPVEVLPGYMTHQTARNDENGHCVRTRFRPADWDLLGWKFSVIASIGTAPFNHVVNFLPARDEREFKAFSAADKKWMRDWFDWTDHNREILRHVKPVLGPPQLGRVDAWAAFQGNRGLVFLFNPNYRGMVVELALDKTIGLTTKGSFMVKQLYPDAEKGRLFNAPGKTFWAFGDKASLGIAPTEALVLEITPGPEQIEVPHVFGVVGRATLDGSDLQLAGVRGEPGTVRTLSIALPGNRQARTLTVNRRPAEFKQSGPLVTCTVRFAGEAFARCQQVGQLDPAFTGGVFKAETRIPSRIFEQLQARKRAWPVDYSESERQAAHLNADRLLLFINVAEPDDEKMQVSLEIGGQSVPVKPAYTSIVRNAPRNTFVGWYADVTHLAPDATHTVEVKLPPLRAGQFQGLFFDTVEADYTEEVAGFGNP